MNHPALKYWTYWLIIGWLMVVLIIYGSLAQISIHINLKQSDKLVHFGAYFILMAWFVQLYHLHYQRLLHAFGLIVLGILLEVVQGYSGYRYFEYADMMANSMGVISAYCLSWTSFSSMLFRFERKWL